MCFLVPFYVLSRSPQSEVGLSAAVQRVFAEVAVSLSDVQTTGPKRCQTCQAKKREHIDQSYQLMLFSKPSFEYSSSSSTDGRSTVVVSLQCFCMPILYHSCARSFTRSASGLSLTDANHLHHLDRSYPLTLRPLLQPPDADRRQRMAR